MRAGFVEREGQWIGSIVHDGGATEVRVLIPERFPFKPARVTPVDPESVAWSWHREIDGALCLVPDDDHENLWWADAPAFLEHVRGWFNGAHSNWDTDRPDLDLDRYFESSNRDSRLYVFGDLEPVSGRFVMFDRGPNGTMKLSRPAPQPRKSKTNEWLKYGYVADLGSVASPPRNWSDISSLIADPSLDLDALIRDRAVSIVVLQYRRDDHDGAVLLEVWPTAEGGIAARRLTAGADTPKARSSRSGPRAPDVRGRRIAIVGAGAVGSFVVDSLVRSGATQITIVDGDRLMPGNLVRHLVGPEAIGMFKPTAIKAHIERRYGSGMVDIDARDVHLLAPDEAIELLTEHELVIDATADFAVTAMLRLTAEAIGGHVLSVVMQNEGHTFRIDVLPSMDGSRSLPRSARPSSGPPATAFESGCGSPISPTPPPAVIEAAAAAARHAVGLLAGAPLSPVGEVRELAAQTASTTAR